MIRSLRVLPALATAAALATLLGACGTDPNNPTQSAPTPLPPTASAGAGTKTNGAATEAARFRAELTALFREEASLTAYVAQTAAASGFQSPQTEAAIETLHHSGAKLTDKIAAVAGDEDSKLGKSEGARLRSAWEEYVGHLVHYVKAAVTEEATLKGEIRTSIYAVEEDLSVIIADITDHTVSEQEAHGLVSGHTGLTTSMIDAIAKAEPSAPTNIVQTGRGGDEIAKSLSRALAIKFPEHLPGDATSEGAALRAHLTGLLAQHVAQTVAVAHLMDAAGSGSERTNAAIRSLHTNMDELAGEIETIYGKKMAEEFTKLYERHIKSLVSFAKRGAQQGPAPLSPTGSSQFAKKFTEFASRLTDGNLEKKSFERAVTEQVEAVKTAIESVAKDDTAAAEEVEKAEAEVIEPAELLSVAIVEQFPDRFAA